MDRKTPWLPARRWWPRPAWPTAWPTTDRTPSSFSWSSHRLRPTRDEPAARRPDGHLPRRSLLSRGGREHRAAAARPGRCGGLSRGTDVLRPAPLQLRLSPRGGGGGAAHAGALSRRRARGGPLGVLRVDGQARVPGAHAGRRRPGRGPRAGGADVGAVAVPRARARAHGVHQRRERTGGVSRLLSPPAGAPRGREPAHHPGPPARPDGCRAARQRRVLRLRRVVLGAPARGLLGDPREEARQHRGIQGGLRGGLRCRVPHADRRGAEPAGFPGAGPAPGRTAGPTRRHGRMSAPAPSTPFRARAGAALGDGFLQEALGIATTKFLTLRREAFAQVPEGEALRDRARAIKEATLARLDHYLEQLIARIEARGGHVHYAATAAEARAVIVDIARRSGAQTAVKSKSMATEEIDLNEALIHAGITPVETDLGEYIIQLAGERPAHIIAPAIHKTKGQVAELFTRELGRAVPAEIGRASCRERVKVWVVAGRVQT